MQLDMARSMFRARFAFCLALCALPFVADAQAVHGNFAERSEWHMTCSLDKVTATGRSGIYPAELFEVTWNRDTGRATLLWPNGHGKELHEIPGNPGRREMGQQYSVHFWVSPGTRKFTTDKAKTSGFIDIGTALFSVRTGGAAAFTRHGVEYGEMRAATVQGICEIDGMRKDEK